MSHDLNLKFNTADLERSGTDEDESVADSVYPTETVFSKSNDSETRNELVFLNQDDYIKLPFLIINPHSNMKMSWQLVVMVIIIYTVVLTPFRIAYNEYSTGQKAVDIIGDIVFLVDLCLQFITAREEANGTLIVNKKQIAVIYLKSWFILDLPAAIPINIIILCFVRSNISLSAAIGFKFLKLLKILQLYRILTLSKLSKLTQHNRILEWLISHI